MGNDKFINIAVAESSIIIRTGITNVLKKLPGLRPQLIEMASADGLQNYMRAKPVDLLIVNPAFGGHFDIAGFRKKAEAKDTKAIALLSTFTDNSVLANYDGSISIFDGPETISEKINEVISGPEQDDDEKTDALSQREKDIVIRIVKGMTNKEIADDLFLSVHTVITHRRNISRKLQIHSVSGLTIYAIVNKLVELKDIRHQIG